MKKLFVFTLATTLALTSCGKKTEDSKNTDSTAVKSASSVTATIKGSDTCLPLSQKFAEAFIGKNAGSNISVVGGGSGVGLSALVSGTTEIAQSSREIKMSEKMQIQETGKELIETIIAYDALATIVNPSNKVSKLTREQLEGIFTGKITNWKEVGGDDMKIIVYSRETSSGTYEFFKEHVLEKKDFSKTALLMPATGAIVQSISQTKGAIGYIGLAYLDANAKALEVSYDQGKTFVAPTVENAKNKLYPITRPLYYYYTSDKTTSIQAFLDFISSDEGQAIVAEVGYIPTR